jgi:hypothetical protein
LYGLVVAGFNGWHGGASVCARYLIFVLPFAALPLIWLPCRRAVVWVLASLGGVSFVNMLAVAAVSPLVGEREPNPLYGRTYERLFAGDLHPYPFPSRLLRLHPEWEAFKDETVWNWGEAFGLSGMPSLIPLLLFLAGSGLLLQRLTRQPDSKRDASLGEPPRV